MRRGVMLGAIGVMLALTGTAQAHPRHWRAFTTGAAVQIAARYWHGLPCALRVQFGPTPSAVEMGLFMPACTIEVNPDAWTARRFRHWIGHDAYQGLGYGTILWQMYCADVIELVGDAYGRAVPFNREVLYRFCGPVP